LFCQAQNHRAQPWKLPALARQTQIDQNMHFPAGLDGQTD